MKSARFVCAGLVLSVVSFAQADLVGTEYEMRMSYNYVGDPLLGIGVENFPGVPIVFRSDVDPFNDLMDDLDNPPQYWGVESDVVGQPGDLDPGDDVGDLITLIFDIKRLNAAAALSDQELLIEITGLGNFVDNGVQSVENGGAFLPLVINDIYMTFPQAGLDPIADGALLTPGAQWSATANANDANKLDLTIHITPDDLNGAWFANDGEIDRVIFAANAVVVPEPATLGLLFASGFLAVRRRRRR